MRSVDSIIAGAWFAGRLEWLRDEERADADALARVLGENAEIVVRMRNRTDELDRASKELAKL